MGIMGASLSEEAPMSKTFRPYEPDQDFLMPASMREWLPGDHLAYFISDMVDQLDLSAIMKRYAREERGYPPYHPAMMVKVLLYAHCIGVPSSRKIEKRLEEDIAFRVLSANNTPDFRTISDFRKEHLAALSGLFLKELLQKAEAVDEEEDRRYGKKERGDQLPQELAFREGRLERIREAKAVLEAEAKEEAERAKAEGKEHPGAPHEEAQRNF